LTPAASAHCIHVGAWLGGNGQCVYDRDSMAQERVAIGELAAFLEEKIEG